MKKTLVAILLALVFIFSATGTKAQTADRTEITDVPGVTARFDKIAGGWNLAYIAPPKSPEHKGVAGWYNTTIFHIDFSVTSTDYVATFTVLKSGIGSNNAETRVYSTPMVYTLSGVDDVVQSGHSRTELTFLRTYTKDGVKYYSYFDIFICPATGRIIGVDFADMAEGGNPEPDGFWAGIRGDASALNAFESTAIDLSTQVSNESQAKFDSMHSLQVWAGY